MARDFNGTNSRLYVTTGLPALSNDFVASVWAQTDGQGENALGVVFSVQDASNNVLVEAQMSGGTQGTGSGTSTEPLWSMIIGHTTTLYARWVKPRARNRWTHFVLWWDNSATTVYVYAAGLGEEHAYKIDIAQTQSLSGTRRVGTSSTNKLYVGDRQSDNRAFDGRLRNLKLVQGGNWTDDEMLAYARAMQQSFSTSSTPGSSGTVIAAYPLNGTGTAAGVVENDGGGAGLNLSTDTGRAPAAYTGPTLPTFRSRAIHFDVETAEWQLRSAREFGDTYTYGLSGSYESSFGTPTSIDARMRGDTTWQTVDPSPAGDVWGGSFEMRVDGDAEVGSGIEVRANFGSPETATWNIGLGDLFVIAGQSNATGTGGNPNDLDPTADDGGTAIYSGSQKAHLLSNYAVSGTHQWMQLVDPVDAEKAPVNIETASRVRFSNWVQDVEGTMDSADVSNYYSTGASASPWPIVAGWWMRWTGRPFGAIPVAKPGAGVTTFEPPSSNFSTLYNSSPAPIIWEETAQRLQQAAGAIEGTTALSDPDNDPIRVQARLIFWCQGESDAINQAANPYATAKSNYEAAYLPLLDNMADSFGTDIMVAVIGQISVADTNDEAAQAVRAALRESWDTLIGTSNQNRVRRGPVLYDLDLGSTGGYLHYRYDDSTNTLRTLAKRWALALYDAELAVDPDEHRGPRLMGFWGSGTTYTALFDRPLDAEASGYNGITIRDGSTLRAFNAAPSGATQYSAVRDSTDTRKVNITFGAAQSGTVNISIGEINSSTGLGRRVPLVTHTADGLTVSVPAENVYRQNATTNTVGTGACDVALSAGTSCAGAQVAATGAANVGVSVAATATAGKLVGGGLDLAVTVAVQAAGLKVGTAVGAVRFFNSGVDGAGFQGHVQVDPRGNGVAIVCADVAGIHRTADWGETWQTTIGWAYNNQHLQVAGCLFSTDNPDIVVILTGRQGTSTGGGVWISTDNGLTFAQESGSPAFSGGNNDNPGVLPRPHPRSTGRLAAIDYSRGFLYVGSFEDGVWRATFDPSTGACGSFTAIGSMSGRFVRGVALDESGDQLFVACRDDATAGDDGVFLITSAHGTASGGTKIAGAPANPEELLYLDGRVYCAAGGDTTSGIYSCTASSPSTWTDRTGTLDTAQSRWQAIDGYLSGSAHVLFVGCEAPTTSTVGGQPRGNAVYRTSDATAGPPTWTSLTALSDDDTPHTYPTGETWWLSLDDADPWAMVNRGGFDCAAIALGFAGGTGDPDWLFAAGRAGLWRLEAPLGNPAGQWHPSVNGLAVTINRVAVADATRPGQVWFGNTDWVIFRSDDHGQNIVKDKPSDNAAYALANDPTSGYVYAGIGGRDTNTLGRVWAKATPTGPWVGADTTTGSVTVRHSFDGTTSSAWPDTTDTTGYTATYSVSGGGSTAHISAAGGFGLIKTGAAASSGTRLVRYEDALATGGSGVVALARAADNAGGLAAQSMMTQGQWHLSDNSYYEFRVSRTAGGALTLAIYRSDSGTVGAALASATITSLGWNIGETLWLRYTADVVGATVELSCAAWTAGEPEPSEPTVSYTDSDPLAIVVEGGQGAKLLTGSGQSNDVTYSWDDWTFDGVGPGAAVLTSRVVGVGAATVGSDRVVVIARQESSSGGTLVANPAGTGGLFRKVGAAGFTQLLDASGDGVMDNQATKEAPFSWPDQGTASNQYVYWYERANGVWRSDDSGATWTRIWATTSNAERTGYLAADPTSPVRLYVSAAGNLYRIADAGTVAAGAASPTDITPSTGANRMSAIACDRHGWLWACGEVTAAQPAKIWRSTDAGATWTDMSDDAYTATAIIPMGLAVGPDDWLYVPTFGNGVLLGDLSDVTCTLAVGVGTACSGTKVAVAAAAVALPAAATASGTKIASGAAQAAVAVQTTMFGTAPGIAVGAANTAVTVATAASGTRIAAGAATAVTSVGSTAQGAKVATGAAQATVTFGTTESGNVAGIPTGATSSSVTVGMRAAGTAIASAPSRAAVSVAATATGGKLVTGAAIIAVVAFVQDSPAAAPPLRDTSWGVARVDNSTPYANAHGGATTPGRTVTNPYDLARTR